MPEAQVYQANSTIETGTSTTQESIFSLVSAGGGTVIYYDHWEDGYEIDLANPAQSTTRIWGDGNNANGIPPGFANDPAGLSAGAVITLRNSVPLPRNPSSILYDGRDRVAGTKALVISRAGWPVTPGSVFAGAVGVLATVDYGTQFVSPVGQDLTNRLFQYVGLFVMAGQDATTITIDPDGNGPVAATMVTLNRGESYLANGGIKKGGIVNATKPVQAHLIIGRIGGRYASDWFTLIPVNQWGNTYYTPVATAANGNPAYVYLFNPNPTAITINYATRAGAGSFSIPATNGVFQFQMPKASGAQFSSAGSQPFFALCTAGANPASESAHNWGFTLLPSEGLTTEVVVGWGPGSSDLTANGSPAWVTPIAATKIYVDYDGDRNGPLTDPAGNKYDTNFDLVALESKRIYDPDKDQTAMRIYTVDGVLITAAWGQDPDVAAAGNPYIDAGSTVLPFPVPTVTKTSIIITDNAPVGLSIGDVLEYTMQLDNKGLLPLGNTVVIDAPPPSLSYVPNTTTLDGTSIPDSPSGTPFPLDPPGYVVPVILRAGNSTFKFQATVLASGSITNTVNVGGTTISAQNVLAQTPPSGSTACNLNFTDSTGVNVTTYAAGTNIFVTLIDEDKNTSSNTFQTLSLSISNAARGDIETITLTETGANSGVFRNITGLISSTTSGLPQQDGVLNVAIGDTITVNYVDPVFGDVCNASATIQVPPRSKILYLSDPSQALDRVDPAASADITTAQSAAVSGNTFATIAVDATSSSSNASASSLTFAHTTGSGANRLMLVSVAIGRSGPGFTTVSSVTYGGTALTFVGATNDTSNARTEIWRLINPPAGTSNVVVSLAAAKPVAAGVTTFTGVDQTTPLGVFSGRVAASAGTTATNISTSASGELVYDAVAVDGDNSKSASALDMSPAAGQTQLWSRNGGNFVRGASSTKAGAASVTNTWTWTTSAQQWALGVISIKPAAGGGGGTNVTSFQQTPVFCSDFILPSGGNVTITNFITVTNGVMPVNPSVSAVLKYNGTNILVLSNAIYTATNNSLVWSGTLSSNVTILSGQAISYVITNNQPGVSFYVEYDSATKPSRIALPTTTVIDISTLGVFDAPYPGGNLVTTPAAGTTLYVRGAVSDPFGSYDITSLNLSINGPGTSSDVNIVLTNSSVVADDGCSKVYEHVWQTTADVGNYDVSAIANEGTEGITDTAAANVTLTFLDLGTPGSIQFTSGNNGSATNSFSANATVCLRVIDLDENLNPTVAETLNAIVSTSTDSETILLTETGTNTGIFAACVNTSTNSGSGNNNSLLNAPVGSVLTASYTDPTDSNDQSTTTSLIMPAPGIPGVQMNKTRVAPTDGQAGIGETVQFDLQVVNTGSTVLTNVSLTDNFPSANLAFQSASVAPNVTNANSLVWTNVGPLNPGESTSISVFFTTSAAGSATNSATANGVTATNTSTANILVTQSSVNLTKTLLSPTNGPVSIGSNVTFRIVVQNTGSTTITSLPLEDNFSAGYFQFVSATVTPDGTGAGSLLWTDLASPTPLATNASITIDVTMLVVGEGNPANNTAAANFAIDNFGNLIPATSSTVGIETAAGRITGFVYNDIDQTGTLTTNDVLLESVEIKLFSDPDADGDPADGALVRLTATDATGAYELLGLTTGAYVVVETDLAGFASSAPVNNRLATNLTSLTTVSNLNFFDYLPDPVNYASISGTVWDDVNFNGTNDVSETELANVNVDLIQDVNTNGQADLGEPAVANFSTGTNGSYSFANVIAGNYVIIETDLFGYTSTGDAQSPNDNQIGIVVLAGSTNVNLDFYDHFNQSPAANDDSVSTPKNISLTIDPLANDSDPENNSLTITNATAGSGSASINGGTNIFFTPATNFTGVATINYSISDGNGGTASAVISVSVTNNVPVANDDGFATAMNTQLIVPATGVLTNDTDLNGDSLTAVLVATTTNGFLSLNPNGGFTYAPNTNFVGTDSFTYRANDGTDDSAITIVTLTVSATDADTVLFKTGPTNVFGGMTFDYTLFVTNAGPGMALNLSVTDSLPANVTFVSASAGGIFTNGIVNWTGFNLANGEVTNLTLTVTAPPNGSFTNIASAGSGANDPEPINNNGTSLGSQVVTAVTNRPPVADDDATNTLEDVAVTIAVLANDNDPEADTLVIVSAIPTNGTVNIVGTNLLFTPTLNFNGTAFINYTITDGRGGTNSALVAITVDPVNDGPVANNQSVTTPEDVSTNIVLIGTDTESVVTYAILNPPTNGIVNGFNANTGELNYAPNTNFNGVDTIVFTVTDGSLSATGIVNITVSPLNDAPIAVDDSYSTLKNIPLNVTASGVLTNDTDVEGGSLTAALVSGPIYAVSFTLNGDGSFSYTPSNNYVGPDSFTYTANDGTTNSGLATVSITVLATNVTPMANSQSVTTPEDVATNLVLTAIDGDGDALTFSVVGGPTNGVLSGLNVTNGTVTYTPNTNFNGNDSFTFQVDDGATNSNIATVSITVTPVNDGPVANNQLVATPEDVSTNIVLSGVDVESAVTFAIVSAPTNGIVSGFNTNSGAFVYTPSTNFNGVDTIVFTVTDGSLLATGIVSLTVTPVNDPPVANDDIASAPEDMAVTIPVLTNDTDADGDALSIVSVNATNGSASIVGTNLLFTPGTNFNGITTVDYAIADGNGATNSAVVTITVNGLNDPPIANDDIANTSEDTVVTLSVLVNDSDPDNHTLTIIDATTTNGVVNIVGTNLVFTPATNFNGVVLIDYTITDGNGGTNSAVVTVTVDPVNDAPIANNQLVTTPEDTSTNIVLSGTDVESVVTFSILDGPTNGIVSGFNPNTGALVYTPNTNFNGTDAIVFTVTDGSLLATGIVSIAVTPANDAPIANDDSYSLLKNTPLLVSAISGVLTNDSDVEGGSLTASLVSDVAHGTLNLLADGSFTYTPSNNYVGLDSFTYRANDGTTNSSVALVNLTIIPTNSAPVANGQNVTTPEDTATNLVLAATDGDGDTLAFIIVDGPTNGVLNGFNPTNGTVTYLPNTNFNGGDSFTFQVNDGTTNSETAIVSITITAVNDGPVAVNQNVITPEDTSTNIVLIGTDTESVVTFAILSGPTNGEIDGFSTNTGALAYSPMANFNGVDAIVFTVSDGTLLATGVVSIVVTPINDAPVANNQNVVTPEDVSTNIVLSGTDTESAVTFAIPSAPTNGIVSGFNANTGEFVYTPNTNFNGVDTIVFTVTDGSLLATGIVNIAVTPVNDPPVADDDLANTPEDTTATISVLTNDTDADSDPLSIVSAITTNGAVNISGTNLLFTPTTNFNGIVLIDYAITDGNGETNSAVVTVTVDSMNDAPIANNQSVATPEDVATNIVLSGTDLESAVTFAILNGPTNGIVSGLNANTGALLYAPNTNYNGVDAIVFTVTDGSLLATGVVSITVTPVNDGPIANNQNVSTPEEVSTNIVLIGTDTESVVTFAILNPPTNGIVSGFNANTGELNYAPNTNFNGVDTIVFTVTDGSLSATGMVSIEVTPVNDAPEGTDKIITILEDTIYPFAIADFGFSDSNDVPTNSFFAVRIATLPTAGALRFLGIDVFAGQIISAAALSDLIFTPVTNVNGLPYGSFVFQVMDDGSPVNGGVFIDQSPNTILINVLPVNDAPAGTDNLIPVFEDQVYAFAATDFGFTDPNDTPSNSFFNVRIATLPAAGTLRYNGLDVFSGQLIPALTLGNLTFIPATNAFGIPYASFTFQVQDDGGTLNGGVDLDFSPNTITIHVLPLNDLPIANDDVATTAENMPVTIAVLANDTDADGDTLSIVSAIATNGTVNVVGTNLVFTPALNFIGAASINYSITDNNGGNDSAIVTVNVGAQADVALFKSGPTNIISGGAIIYTLFVTNSGPSSALDVSVVDRLPTNLTFQSASSGGTFSSNAVTWSSINLAPGAFTNYTLVAIAPANGSFTNIALASSTTPDPNDSNNNGTANESQVATAAVAPEFGILQGPNVFNPQTGLFEQQVTVTNTAEATISAMRLYVDGLSSGVFLRNATGTNAGRPYVQYNAPMNPNETVVFRLEFYVPSRQPFSNSLEAVAILPETTGTNPATGVAIDRVFMDTRIVGEPRYVIEFSSIPGRVYTVIYSDDEMNTWRAATPSFTAGANQTQWYDDGPPKTVSKPSAVGSRFYQVILAPVNP